jgi:hypothetical protein
LRIGNVTPVSVDIDAIGLQLADRFIECRRVDVQNRQIGLFPGKGNAISRPMPAAPPVITTFLPASDASFFQSIRVSGCDHLRKRDQENARVSIGLAN